ncbi:MAG: NUDIX domain-containing protein, partial [Acidobacteria bacterium]|nr:NUDIX domain-containing protein [Acidobacteriota bacterium]
YYSRARNLQRAAKLLVSRGQTTLPSSYEALLQLPGIGPYTAAAIASIAFQQVKACLDGNVLRVLSRVMASDLPIDVPANRNTFQDWADQMVDPDRPGDFNQAMMELGATLCKPKSPKCTHCPIQPYCRTVQNHEDPQTRPQKAGRVSVKTIAFQTVLIQQNGRFWLGQRPTKGLLANLWEFPGWPIEQNSIFDTPITSSEFVAHRFTHLDATYHIAFLDQPLATPWPEGLTHYQEFQWLTPKELSLFPLTKATHKILKLLAQPVLPMATERL